MKKHILFSLVLIISVKIMNAQDQSAKPSAAEYLAAAIKDHGLDTARKMFVDLRENPGDYNFSEQEFNALGNKFLDGQKYE